MSVKPNYLYDAQVLQYKAKIADLNKSYRILKTRILYSRMKLNDIKGN